MAVYRKSITILLGVISILVFSSLVYYGFKHTRGIPVKIEEPKRELLEAPYMDKRIDFANGIDSAFWGAIASKEIKLLYQVMILPWPKTVTPSITVKAFHNNKDIYFYISWKDETENRTLGINKFSDACAVMFPLDKNVQTPALMMGFLGKANIWHWKASRDIQYWQQAETDGGAYADYYYPFEEKETLPVSKEAVKSAVNDLISIGVATVTPKVTQGVTGRGFWKDGVWQVAMRRSLQASDPEIDANIETGKRLCAFAVWNGQNGDRAGRKSISDWMELEIQ